ncbi:MAG: alpha/beta hydrolase [Clostridia bacterium]|nr:alpha/beta hydrolase [Clostridia bacterium]
MRIQTIPLHPERGVTLTAYLQDVGGEYGFLERPAMLVIPGGAYQFCSDREAEPIALAYANAGYQAFVLRYTVGDACAWPQPLDDYEDAMQLILDHARQWHVAADKIAIVGFSAGGHLAACAATLAQHKPAAAVLVYPVIFPDSSILPAVVTPDKPRLPSAEQCVDSATCPCFFAHGRDDRTVDIRHTLAMEQALAMHGIPFESHIYSRGTHGFSTAVPLMMRGDVCARVKNWVADSIGWLAEQLGTLTYDGFVPV